MRNKLIWMILLTACLSCHKENNDSEHSVQGMTPTPSPTEDVVGYTTYANALILGDPGNTIGRYMTSRLMNATTDAANSKDIFDIVVINELGTALNNEQAISSCVESFNNGGSIILFNPSSPDFAKFHETISAAQEKAVICGTPVKNMPCSIQTVLDMVKGTLESSESERMPAVIMKSTGVCYAFPSPDKIVISEYEGVRDEQTDLLTDIKNVTPETEVEPSEPTSYTNGKMCDDLLKWAETENASPQGELEDIASAGVDITIYRNFDYDSRDAGCSMLYRRHISFRQDYRVWSIYDTNNKRDLYLVRSSIVFQGSQLGCGPSDPKYWWADYQGEGKYYGPYLYEIKSTTGMDGCEPKISDVHPFGYMGSSTYSSGFNWSLNGGVTLSSKPGVNFGGSLIITQSWSTSTPHLKLDFKLNENKPEYRYYAGVVPDSRYGIYVRHDTANEDLRRDINMNQKWIWTIPSKPGDSFFMSGNLSATIQMLSFRVGFFKTYPIYSNATYHGNNGFKIALPSPPRVGQRWRESCVPASDKLNQFLTLKYSGMFFHSIFYVPAHTENETTKIDAFIDDFTKNILPHDKQIWKDNGLTGKYTFRWKRAEQDVDYKTFEFVVE